MIITVNSDLSSHVVIGDNEKECFLPSYNPETLIPFASEDEVRAFIATSLTENYFQPYKSPEERKAELQANKAAANAARAKQDLVNTDWCENSSVRDTNNTHHLINSAEFDAYRTVLRGIIVNKTADVETWPTKPTAVWS